MPGFSGECWERNEGNTFFFFYLDNPCLLRADNTLEGKSCAWIQVSGMPVGAAGQALSFGKYMQSLSVPDSLGFLGFHRKVMSGSLLAPVGCWPASAGGPTSGRVWLGMPGGGGEWRGSSGPQEGSICRAGQPLRRALESMWRAGSWAQEVALSAGCKST